MEIRDVSQAELLELLKGHRFMADAPIEELEWIAARAKLRHFEPGDITGSPSTGILPELAIVISGSIGIYREGGGPRRITGWSAGDVTGMLPYSRLKTPPGETKADEPTEVITLHQDHFPDLIRECPVITTRLVRLMVDRARRFQQYDLHDEKMKSLGRLSAGLAHELDNPAAAVIRSAKLLAPLLEEADTAARALGRSGLPDEDIAAIESLRRDCSAAPLRHLRSPLEQARHEEAIADWLEERGIELPDLEGLSDTPITVETLDALESRVSRDVLGTALRWVAAGCAIHSLAAELNDAASRITHLVRAVKGFTQMDTAASPAPVDVVAGLGQTLAVIRSKARSKSARVEISAQPDLPRVMAVAGELNQIWLNLIENALDAIETGGSVQAVVAQEGDRLIVRIIDNGSGIPAEDLQRIFEPFYTTKPVGSGTGLGLDIVRKLLERNNGEIEVTSVPGRTEFRVSLPIIEPSGGGGA